MRLALIILAALLFSGPASAVRVIVVGGSGSAAYTGPGDVIAFTAWWGLRAYSAAEAAAGTQKLFNLRRDSDNETCDFIVNTGGGVGSSANCSGADNGQSLSTFIGAANGFFVKIYDHVGTKDLNFNSLAANQPPILLNCIGVGLPCINATLGNQSMVSSTTFTPASGLVSFAVEANRASGTNQVIFLRNDGSNTLRAAAGNANTWQLSGNASSFNVTAADGAFHSGVAVLNGVSSVVAIDGVENTGTATGNTAAGTVGFVPATGDVFQWVEGGFLDNSAFSSGNRSDLHTNMSNYWGSP